MSYLIQPDSELESFICEEVVFGEDVARGERSDAAKRTQEWLNLHGHNVGIDGDFGAITESAVVDFQNRKGLANTGIVDFFTHAALVAPMIGVLHPILNTGPLTFGGAVAQHADSHLAANPREVGGANCGPWVRLYMWGNDGEDYLWCAGFVTFVMKQAAESLATETPIEGSFSCDTLAGQAKDNDWFLSESERSSSDTVPPVAAVFLSRKTSTDWTHTGFVTRFDTDFFDTVEGNTNDEGHREGYEVCARRRGYAKKDFILLGD